MSEARVERRHAAILAADVAGYSRLMSADEVGTLAALKSHRREIVDPTIAAHKGRIVKTTGDGILVEFGSAVDAVTCAMAVQEKMAVRTAYMPTIVPLAYKCLNGFDRIGVAGKRLCHLRHQYIVAFKRDDRGAVRKL